MITRNVGSSGASTTTNTTALQNAMKLALTDVTEIVLGANSTYTAVSFERNITNFPLTIRCANSSAPPIMEGIRFCGTSTHGFYNKLGSIPGATTLKDITIDGLHFIPRALTQVIRVNNPGNPYIIQDAPQGLRWRIDPSFEGFQETPTSDAYSAQNAYMIALHGFSGTQNLTVQNCYFRGYGRVANLGSGANGFKFRHNTLERWHEDGLFIGGGANITIEYNLGLQCEPLSYRDAFYGWGYGYGAGQPPPGTPVSNAGQPPHSDFCQLYGKTTNFIYQYNEVYDDSARAHPLLAKIQDGNNPPSTSSYHTGMRVINNFARSSHPTQWWFKYTTGVVIERNKGLKVGSENVSLDIDVEFDPGATIRNNRAQKINDGNPTNTPASWTVSGNVETNVATDMPPGWVEFRRGHANLAEGAPFAGQYGGGGVGPTQPAALTAGQVAFDALVQDPAFPDARRTFTIRVPAGSPAEDAPSMYWTSDADTTVRGMTQLADSAGDQIWRAASTGGSFAVEHLRSPNETFTNVKLYYRETTSGPLSLPSTYTFTETVPDVGNPDPIVTDVINMDQTRRVSLAEGDAFRLVTKEDGIVWQMPG